MGVLLYKYTFPNKIISFVDASRLIFFRQYTANLSVSLSRMELMRGS